jgi:hypothetical protein
MFFEFIKCKKCGQTAIPSQDLTIDSYKDEGFFTVPLDFGSVSEPPTVPTYIIFKCSNTDCQSIEKIEHKDILIEISSGLSKIAWELYKQEFRKTENFEQYVTRYILDKGVNSFIREDNIATHPILKEYVKLIRNAK